MAYRRIIPQNIQPRTGGALSSGSRSMRRPRHEAQFRIPPWCIFPFGFAPVVPGDTVTQCDVLGRVVSDPVDGKLLPWWLDIFGFYVPWRATAASTQLQAMALGNGGTNFAFNGGTIAPTVSGGGYFTSRLNGRPDFGALAYQAVVTEYFRDEGETYADHVHALSGMSMMKLGRSDWTDSLLATSVLTGDDVNVDLNASGTIMASEVESALRSYELLRQGNLTEMTFEDYLGTFGIRVTPAEREFVPELLYHRRTFQYPSNVVTQGTGAVTSAVSWSVNERFSQNKLIREPGWLLFMVCVRPKVYRAQQTGAIINLMDNAYMWMPAVLRDDPATSLVAMDTVSGAVGSVSVNSGNHTFDLRDLFVHGDQVVYCSPSVAGADSIAAGGSVLENIPAAEVAKLPRATNWNTAGRPDYPHTGLTGATAYFVGSTNETNLIQGELTTQLSVLSTVLDRTPGVPVR